MSVTFTAAPSRQRGGLFARRLARWLATSLLLLFVVSVLTFVLVSLAPGDAARTILGQTGTQEQYLALRDQLGLDDPLIERYGQWLGAAVQGDLGSSIFSNQSVSSLIGSRLGVTLSLVAGSLLFSVVVGVALGVAGARSHGPIGRAIDVVALVGVSIPTFWLGFLLVSVFAVALPLFPATGYIDFGYWPFGWFLSLVLPVLTLGIGGVAVIAKQTRDAMRTQLDREFVTAMRAQGLSERSIVYRHVLRNAAIPVTTVIGLMMIGLFSGTVLVENVFALPGLGGLVVEATSRHDIPVVQGVALTFALFVVVTNLLIDVLSGILDPKARTA
ncbi:ABC transporter permease [Microbacterium hydrocarbonoxydans]|uniref:ABC transporter permease n=1 Tax=Microbacterium hydrocarbonoxydans TaxID=273678 RepID=UPI00203B7262|nr:ABC transporter permease [Microbacterium hydrocarbonoxydans]MCM3778415.1 ABC transporter permease [Microbacterium hydrocarbonoxydans]